MKTARIAALRGRILGWYSENRRDLPWRRTHDPYAVWVSEIMLQQTRVETVIPFYERFLRRFPDIQTLAEARESHVLAAWSGLGYYRRARNMQAAARTVMERHQGRFPRDRDPLLALPGIGSYTASAIASIAFGRPAAAVDGNVERVLARIFGLRGRSADASLRREVTRAADALAPGDRPGDWTQALMELGALVCLPRDPLCSRCPVARSCAARRSGHPERFPQARVIKAPREERRVLLVARSRNKILLVPDEADSSATWTLPYRVAEERAAYTLAATLFGRSARPDGPHATFQHRTFSHALTFEVWSLEVKRTREKHHLWASPEDLERTPVRSHTLKALRRLSR